MIAKHIRAPKGSSGYQRLAAYVLNVGAEYSQADPASWTRLNAYALDGADEKVAWARASNCGSADPGWAVRDILATQARNTRSGPNRSYHLVASFPEGERPNREQMAAIEDRLCSAIGYGEHQRVSAVHQNTDTLHLHVAISKVHPVTLRNVSPHRDYFRLQEVCAALEVEHRLTREPHTVDERARMGRIPAFAAWIRDNAKDELLAARDLRQGWGPLHRVAASYGLVLRPCGSGLVFRHSQDSRLRAKASSVDRGLGVGVLTATLGAYAAPGATREPQRRVYPRKQSSERLMGLSARGADPSQRLSLAITHAERANESRSAQMQVHLRASPKRHRSLRM